MLAQLLKHFKSTWFRVISPASLNRFSAKCYLLAVACIWSYGVLLIGPLNIAYLGWGGWAGAFNAAFPTFCLAQMMLNWLLIRRHRRPFVGVPLQLDGDWVVSPKDPSKVVFRKRAAASHQPQSPQTSPELYNAYSVGRPMLPPTTVADPQLRRTIAEDHKYSYLSHKPCFTCRHWRPARTHHCPLCDICVAKRDHHCFFTGTCIGLGNERFFLVFIFYAVLAATYGFVQGLVYAATDFVPRLGLASILLPVTVGQAAVGVADWRDCALVFTGYCLLFFEPLLLGFLLEQVELIRLGGLLSIEVNEKLPIVSSLTPAEALRQVFGQHWWVNFVAPAHWLLPQPAADLRWPHLRMRRDVKVTLMPVNYGDLSQRIRFAA